MTDLDTFLDAKYIKIFVAVAETKSMSAVAKQFGISQSAVSQTIRSLEEQLRVTLLSRNRRPLALTRQGEIFYDYSLKILALQNETIGAVRDLSGNNVARLHIAMANSCAETIAPKLVSEFGELASQWKISSGITPDHIELFLERRVDMVITIDEMLEGEQDIDRFELMREPYVLALPANYKNEIDIEAIARKLPLIRYGLNSRTGRRIEQQLNRMNVSPPRWIEIESVIGQMKIINSGKGFGLTTPLCFTNLAEIYSNVRLVPLPRASFSRQINLLARKKEDHVIAAKIANSCQKILRNESVASLVERFDWLSDSFKFDFSNTR